MNVVWVCDMKVRNELSECTGRWTWECAEKKSEELPVMAGLGGCLHKEKGVQDYLCST